MNSMTELPQPKETPLMTTYDARDLIQDGGQVSIVLDDQRYFLVIHPKMFAQGYLPPIKIVHL